MHVHILYVYIIGGTVLVYIYIERERDVPTIYHMDVIVINNIYYIYNCLNVTCMIH